MSCQATLTLEDRVFTCELEEHRGPHTCSFQRDSGKGVVKLRWHGDDRCWHFRIYGSYVDPEFSLREKGVDIDQPITLKQERDLLLEARVTPSSGVVASDQAEKLVQTLLNDAGIFPRLIRLEKVEGV